MDKETLSNYGWVVIAVLVLSIMIALATPFGTYIGNAVKSTTEGLFKVEQKALGAAGLVVDDQEFDVPDMNHGAENGGNAGGTPEIVVDHNGATIPEGATYTKADGTLLNAGDAFPETITNGDIYIYGDYTYTFNKSYMGVYPSIMWMNNGTYDGWHVVVTDKTKTEYSSILESINGKSVKSMVGTFAYCTSLSDVSNIAIPTNVTDLIGTFDNCTSLTDLSDFVIPNQVTSLHYAFSNCSSLTTAPKIPSNVKSLYYTFNLCKSLTTAPEIPDSVTDMTGTFFSCTSLNATVYVPCSATTNVLTNQSATMLRLSVRHVNGCDGSCGK